MMATDTQPPKASKKRADDWGGVRGHDGVHYAGEAHESLIKALAAPDAPEHVYARSVPTFDPETREYKGNRWEYVDVTELPPGGAIPGEYRRVKVEE
jgi:hypothetical protein